ncbi:MAG: UvrD-helicase domain-containing protein [Rhodoferax sp.]|nr:UvrD-helicase domain-containing protein [Rhodoferax sp.]
MLIYKDLDTRKVKSAFAKVRAAIEANDFRSPDIKKLAPTHYWRAKLDYSNRLLLQFARYGDQTVCLALEVIENHAYEKSRFLRGAALDEAKVDHEPVLTDAHSGQLEKDAVPLRWLHPLRSDFELLDKPILFDDAQEAVRRLPPPVVVVGSAGSGKTAVTLAKLREAEGRVLYVTQSAYLAQSARALYDAHGYENPKQEADFLSYRELIETLRVPVGREVSFAAFAGWFERHRQTLRSTLGELDAHALFEEFRGVLSAGVQGPLALPDYLALGPRQSLLGAPAREAAHGLFQRYRQWLSEVGLFDLNLVAHEWLALAQADYDFVVVDEVQDLTNVQLALVLACLKKPGNFLLCGDSNQIVHPNFFSWAAVRSLFWRGLAGEAAQRQTLSVLQANFRNTRKVTELANALLKIKQARFGSIDRESNFLVQSASTADGAVRLMPARDASLRELDTRTRGSVQHAVVVLRDEDKAAAREHFRTPLLFSVHEAKGLEYPHVILYALVSGQRAAYAEVCNGVTAADLEVEALDYSRARDKGDKSLELFKFYVNALYVAMTRAVESLVLVESDTTHPLLGLMGLVADENAKLQAAVQTSTREEWAQEARKLEQQGKEEQARAIREAFLQSKPTPWTPWSEATLRELLPKALDRAQPSNKPRQTLLDYALWHGHHAWVEQLAVKAGFAPARTLVPGEVIGVPLHPTSRDEFNAQKQVVTRAVTQLRQRHLAVYAAHNFKDILRQCDQFGVDHRNPQGATALMMAARAGNLALVDALLQRGADPLVRDEFGHTAWWTALSRALEDPQFAGKALGGLFERIGPAALDVQSAGRLLRLERHQGEYWLLSLMLAGFKTLRTRCVERSQGLYDFSLGYFAEPLQQTLEALPEYLWIKQRRKRSYISAVLARAEVQSQYQPARKLWVRTKNGHYLPNPNLQLRAGETTAGTGWKPVFEVLNLPWVDAGTALEKSWYPSLERLAATTARRAGAAGETEEDIF